MMKWVVAVMWNGAPDGADWHYLDKNGDPFAENLGQAHRWPGRAAALKQAEKWEEARIEPATLDTWRTP